MSDPILAAKSARESLARALAAIQSDPGVPTSMQAIAEPVSKAMGALFQIERSGGAAAPQTAPAALDSVRRALAMLQQQSTNHPALQIASEAVASALGLVHSLASSRPPAPAAQPAAVPPIPSPAVPAQAGPAPARGPQAYAATQVGAPLAPAAALAAAVAVRPAAQASSGATPRVDAELGAHSVSNFYKGLSGNDVVEHGGLFVATYNIPHIGQTVNLHVSMPGGYEFDALAVVRWTRDTVESSAGQGAEPGFGAQFTHITPESKQLIYRYVRNREPLFHDDL